MQLSCIIGTATKGLRSMTYYLIDYENTGENGLRGITELQEDACIVIFYSENADKISFDMHQKLIECKAAIEYRKISTGKRNALDFQLSTYLGYLIARCENDAFYIVSKDNGYRVVVDFWKDRQVQQIDRISFGHSRAEAEAQPEMKHRVEGEAQPEMKPRVEGETQPEIKSRAEAETQPEMKSRAEGEAQPEMKSGAEGKAQPEMESKPEGETRPEAESRPETEVISEGEGRVEIEPAAKSNVKPEGKSPAKVHLSEEELRELVAQVIVGEEEQENICRFITKYKTKQGVNNAIMKLYGSEKAGELYKKIKPLIKDKKGK